MYLVGTFTMAVILYVSTGIQFSLTTYFIDVLGFAEQRVFIAYAIVSFTGPTSGCAFGTNFYIQEATLSQKLVGTKIIKLSTMYLPFQQSE